MAQIVLVEDDAAAAALIGQYVEQLPGEHRLAVFANAASALAWASVHPAGLFLLDIRLPDYRGTQLGLQLRALPEHRFTPILFATGLAGEELVRILHAEGKTILLTSHNGEDIGTLCDEAYALEDGRLRALSGEEVKKRFQG